MRCRDCGEILSETEIYYYEDRCNACEGKRSERINRWRHGAADPALDEAADGGDMRYPQGVQ